MQETEISSSFSTGYVVRFMGQAMQLGLQPVDKDMLRKALDFCVSNQHADGHFIETGYSIIATYPEEAPQSRPIRFTCFILVAILQNRDFLQKPYADEVKRAFKYVDSQTGYDNYATALCVYAMALSDGKVNEEYVKKLNLQSEHANEEDEWNLEEGRMTSKYTQILIASYTEMAYVELFYKTFDASYIKQAKRTFRWIDRNVIQERIITGLLHSSITALEAIAVAEDASIKSDPVQSILALFGYKEDETDKDSNYFNLTVTKIETSVYNEIEIEACITRFKNESEFTSMELILPIGYAYTANKSNLMDARISVRKKISGGETIRFFMLVLRPLKKLI